ncbi:CHAT domain-containing protein, partial [Mycena vulgaris]
GDLKDLEAAVKTDQEAVNLTFQEAVDLTPAGHPDRATQLQNLAVSLRDQYLRLGDLKDLEAAVQTAQEAVNITPPGHPDQAGQMQGLAVLLTDRYQRLGDLNDLEVALQTKQEAVNLTPIGHPAQAGRLQSLAVSLQYRYQMLGDLGDLETAVQTDQKAVDLTPLGHPDRAGRLKSLVSLTDRYRRLGDLKDLKAALLTSQEAVNLTPLGHPGQPGRLQNLAVLLNYQYRRPGDLKALDAAVQTAQEAIDLTPPGHPDQAGRLQGLSVSLTDRYKRLGGLKDLEAAAQTDKKAVDLTPPGHPDRAGRLQSLAVSLTDQYERSGDLKDLETALQTMQEAVNLTLPGHPTQAGRLQSLAALFRHRYQRLRYEKDLEATHTHYNDSFKVPSWVPEDSWKQALYWADFAQHFQPSDCIPAFQAAFNLLPELLCIGHSISERHDAIHRLNISGATSTAIQTCIKLCHFHTAVEILEQGLATIFQQMLQLKTDVDVLPPNQAKEFRDLSSQLYNGTSVNPIETVDNKNKLLNTIRKQPGFENFLRPKSYNVLCHSSQGGPVVILTSHTDHCNGIILLNPASEPVHVALPTVTLKLLKSQREMLKGLLDRCNVRNRGQSLPSRLFGQQTVSENMTLFLSSLIFFCSSQHRISNGRLWWLPTGGFTGLPLHASPSPTDEFIHSYTATLGSLLDSYTKRSSDTAPKLAVVGLTYTDSKRSNSLKGVVREVQNIISIVKEPIVQCVVGEQATVDAVKLKLQDCSWVHLACHGHQNLVQPAKSHLQLYGGNLELETILRMPLQNAQFVFLAACQTAMGDAELVNESFHLGGGFITAGFRSAVGTMWSMNDEDGPTVAEIVYSHLFRDGQQPQASDAAEALQLAVKELKNRKVPYERWIPFIHIG